MLKHQLVQTSNEQHFYMFTLHLLWFPLLKQLYFTQKSCPYFIITAHTHITSWALGYNVLDNLLWLPLHHEIFYINMLKIQHLAQHSGDYMHYLHDISARLYPVSNGTLHSNVNKLFGNDGSIEMVFCLGKLNAANFYWQPFAFWAAKQGTVIGLRFGVL